ncbi:DUF202 domain-containing protein [Rhodococcus sp. IEGM 1305]|uniref:YidH family protein n=1 Tax=Rhodococcus sp. IEGM 1305 TaxID=3047092 RepID=UPI0024B74D14|nr:DUF202 domain-containing protein [Rhodococcus sp. IEGM 1305]MDI9948506.1 DUF202 domain-containing protein [Rhodococcus sp. IEGM 1305]
MPDHPEPDYRFTLANERTFLAWIRTSLALIAGAVAVTHLAPTFGNSSTGAALAIGSTLLAVTIIIGSYFHWRSVQLAMRRGLPLPTSPLMRILVCGTTGLAVLTMTTPLLG